MNCTACPQGSYSGGQWSVQCSPTQCPPGRAAPAGARNAQCDCSDCPCGSFSPGGAESCRFMKCPEGQRPGFDWGATHEVDGCEICPCGKYNDVVENSNCDPQTSCKSYTCSGGRYPTGIGRTNQYEGCTNCPAGRFQPVQGQATCVDADRVLNATRQLLDAEAVFRAAVAHPSGVSPRHCRYYDLLMGTTERDGTETERIVKAAKASSSGSSSSSSAGGTASSWATSSGDQDLVSRIQSYCLPNCTLWTADGGAAMCAALNRNASCGASWFPVANCTAAYRSRVQPAIADYLSMVQRHDFERICVPAPPGRWATEGSFDTFATRCVAGQADKRMANASTDCLQCAAGQYAELQSDGVTVCSTCAPGFFSTPGDTASCRPQNCPAGQAPGGGFTEGATAPTGATSETDGCVGCLCGRYAARDDSAACTPSTAATNCNNQPAASRAELCTAQTCPAGKQPTGVQASAATGGCVDCPAGQYQTDASFSNCSAGCIDCPCGRYSGPGQATACAGQACPLGMQPTGNARTALTDSCESCPAGTYQDQDFMSECQSCATCPAGQYSVPHSTICRNMACPAGRAPNKVQSTSSTDGCTNCPIGRFSEAASNHVHLSTSCLGLDCAYGSIPPRTTGLPNALYGPLNTSRCSPCPAGRFMDTDANSISTQCKVCPCGRWAPAGARQCQDATCPPGTQPLLPAVVDLDEAAGRVAFRLVVAAYNASAPDRAAAVAAALRVSVADYLSVLADNVTVAVSPVDTDALIDLGLAADANATDASVLAYACSAGAVVTGGVGVGNFPSATIGPPTASPAAAVAAAQAAVAAHGLQQLPSGNCSLAEVVISLGGQGPGNAPTVGSEAAKQVAALAEEKLGLDEYRDPWVYNLTRDLLPDAFRWGSGVVVPPTTLPALPPQYSSPQYVFQPGRDPIHPGPATSVVPFPPAGAPHYLGVHPLRRGAGAAAAACANCPAGQYQAAVNNSQCGFNSCLPCAVGTWSSNGSAACLPMECPLGLEATVAEAKNPLEGCTACPCGKYGLAGSTCRDYWCPPGSVPTGSANTFGQCAECPVGRFNPRGSTPGACDTACAECADGTVTCHRGTTRPTGEGATDVKNWGCCRAGTTFDMPAILQNCTDNGTVLTHAIAPSCRDTPGCCGSADGAALPATCAWDATALAATAGDYRYVGPTWVADPDDFPGIPRFLWRQAIVGGDLAVSTEADALLDALVQQPAGAACNNALAITADRVRSEVGTAATAAWAAAGGGVGGGVGQEAALTLTLGNASLVMGAWAAGQSITSVTVDGATATAAGSPVVLATSSMYHRNGSMAVGPGAGAALALHVAAGPAFTVEVTAGGTGYFVGNTLTIPAAAIPGATTGELVITLAAADLTGCTVTGVTASSAGRLYKPGNTLTVAAADIPGATTSDLVFALVVVGRHLQGDRRFWRCSDYMRKAAARCEDYTSVAAAGCEAHSDGCTYANTQPFSDTARWRCMYRGDYILRTATNRQPIWPMDPTGAYGVGCRGSSFCVDARCTEGYEPATTAAGKTRSIPKATITIADLYSYEQEVELSPRCVLCPAGTYSTGTGPAGGTPTGWDSTTNTIFPHSGPNLYPLQCATCPAGRFSLGSTAQILSIECPEVTCRAGWYHDKPGATLPYDGCKRCACGKYKATEGSAPCSTLYCCNGTEVIGENDANGFEPGFCDARGCRPCAAGKYQDKVRNSECNSCKVCPCGKWSFAGSQECFPSECDAGTVPTSEPEIRTSKAHGCTICPAGKYMDQDASFVKDCDTCKACSQGQFTDGLQKWRQCGAQQCPPGYEPGAVTGGAKNAVDGCVQCTCGRYQPATSATSCLTFTCPSGYGAVGTGVTSATAGCSLCPAGKYSRDATDGLLAAVCRPCLDCECGKYSSSGASECLTMSCPAGTRPVGEQSTTATETCAACPDNYFNNLLFPNNANCSVTCAMCPVIVLNPDSGSHSITTGTGNPTNTDGFTTTTGTSPTTTGSTATTTATTGSTTGPRPPPTTGTTTGTTTTGSSSTTTSTTTSSSTSTTTTTTTTAQTGSDSSSTSSGGPIVVASGSCAEPGVKMLLLPLLLLAAAARRAA